MNRFFTFGRVSTSTTVRLQANGCANARLLSGASSSKGHGGLGAVQDPSEIPTLKLYRDCMKLTYHIAAHSAKGEAMRQMVRSSFRAQLHVTDPKEIHRLKMLAVVGLQNYVIHEQTGKALEKRKRDRGPGAAAPPKEPPR